MNTLAPPTVLVIENEALLLMEFEQALEEEGFLTVTATNGADALTQINNDCSRFSAILTDIDLGSEVSGWDIARRARELSPAMPIVYMSGHSSQDWRIFGVPESIMLAKPFASAQLVTAVAALITDARSMPKATD
jgi:DNA-binding response OmpR family regulator